MSVKRKLTLFFLGVVVVVVVVVVVEKRWDKKKQGNLKGTTELFKTQQSPDYWQLPCTMPLGQYLLTK